MTGFKLGQRVRCRARLQRDPGSGDDGIRRWIREPMDRPREGIVVRYVNRYDGRIISHSEYDEFRGTVARWNEWVVVKTHSCVEVVFNIRHAPVSVPIEDLEVIDE